MLSIGRYFWILNVFLLVFVINSVFTGGRSGEHVHIKLHIPQVYKKHTHVQTIVKHHFHPAPPPKPKKVHHYHHHQHAHKSKSKSRKRYHFEHAPIHHTHASHSSHSHYEIPTYVPKKLPPVYSSEYDFDGGHYKPLKSSGFRPSLPLYHQVVEEEEQEHVPEYNYSETHEDIMEEPESEYDETKTTPFYTAPLLNQHQPLHTSFRSSSVVNHEDIDSGAASHWDDLINKKYKSSDPKLESPHSTIWPHSMPSDLETYSTITQYTKPSGKKIPKFVYESNDYEIGYPNSDFSPSLFGSDSSSGSAAKAYMKWPSSYSSRLNPSHTYED